MSRPLSPRNPSPPSSYVRVNGKIRAREVRVIGVDGSQMGVIPLNEALNLARTNAVDLVEIAPNANPPVCRLIDYGKYRYEQSKREKESKKHQHANRVKEVQLSPSIDPHDFGVKLGHAMDFLCDEMKVKLTLKFRGREMIHQEFGFQVVDKFIKELLPYGHPDAPPKLVGKGINVMLSPLPRNKRAKNPRQTEGSIVSDSAHTQSEPAPAGAMEKERSIPAPAPSRLIPEEPVSEPAQANEFVNNPFTQLNVRQTT